MITEVGIGAMRVRILVSVLGIFAAGGLIFEPIEASARGGAFAGRAVPGHQAATIRPPIVPPQPVVAPVRARAAPFAHIRHRLAPAAVWVVEPWYDDYSDSTLVPPDEQALADPTPSPDGANVIPHRLGCTKQNYRVRSEEGGTRTVAVIRC